MPHGRNSLTNNTHNYNNYHSVTVTTLLFRRLFNVNIYTINSVIHLYSLGITEHARELSFLIDTIQMILFDQKTVVSNFILKRWSNHFNWF